MKFYNKYYLPRISVEMKGPLASDTEMLSPLKQACMFILRLVMIGALASLACMPKVAQPFGKWFSNTDNVIVLTLPQL